MTRYEESLKRFKDDTDEHEMTVLHDDGLYRHIRFQKPGTSMYYYDLVTFPGKLVITGDMGTYVFARIEDMFNFFGNGGYGINPGYWGQKVEALDKHGKLEEHSEAMFRKWVQDHWLERMEEYEPTQRVKIRAAIDREILKSRWLDLDSAEGAIQALQDFEEVEGFRYYDAWDHAEGWREYSVHYLWACWAIQEGIAQYTKAKVPA